MTVATDQPAGATAIRTYRVDIPEEALEDLHRRIAATRWPDMETVDDGSQGTPLAKLQELVRHWGTGYDWPDEKRRCRAAPGERCIRPAERKLDRPATVLLTRILSCVAGHERRA